MDSKDFRLLIALHENARQSYRSLGRQISLSAPAVRDRLGRLRQRGILRGFWLYVEPVVFDRQDLMVFFRGDWTREDALKALETDNVIFVTWKLDGGLSVQLWPRQRASAVKSLTSALGTRPSGQAFSQPLNHPKTSPVDWRIMDALVDDPTIPFHSLVGKTGLSPKTLRKHLTEMIENETIYVMPLLGSLADSGEVVYHLAVSGKIGMADLRKTLGEAFLVGDTHDPPMKYLLCKANDLADATARTQATRKLPGIKSVEVTLNREMMISSRFLHSLIQEKIGDWQEARRQTNQSTYHVTQQPGNSFT